MANKHLLKRPIRCPYVGPFVMGYYSEKPSGIEVTLDVGGLGFDTTSRTVRIPWDKLEKSLERKKRNDGDA